MNVLWHSYSIFPPDFFRKEFFSPDLIKLSTIYFKMKFHFEKYFFI